MLVADGFDAAVIGVVHRCGMGPVTLYDQAKCIDILVGQGLSMDDAMDHFSFNVSGAYVGPDTPCFAILDPTLVHDE